MTDRPPSTDAPGVDALVLLTVRLKGAVQESVLVERGLSEREAAAVLDRAHGAGWVVRREGRLAGWVLTDEGRRAGEALLAAEVDALGARPALAGAYHRFQPLNDTLLAICTAWQVREVDGRPTVNDHSSPEYDGEVLRRLTELHGDAMELCTTLGAAVGRLAGYGVRLQHAMTRVAAGQTDWITAPVVDSYHTVWFELHEDLLATLGLNRAEEAARRRAVADATAREGS